MQTSESPVRAMTVSDPRAAFPARPGRRDRLHARLAGVGRSPKALRFAPAPLWTGDGAAARRLAAGRLLLAGALVEAPGESPFDQAPPTAPWEDALHGFDWLDDLAAAPDAGTREALTSWVHDWIRRFGAGDGPGWRSDLTGRRLTRLACHAPRLLEAATPAERRALLAAIGRQTRFLRRRWRSAPAGLPRFQAAAGLAFGGLAAKGADGGATREGIAALGREAERRIGDDGGLPSRSPEDVVETFAILTWAARSLDEAGATPAPAHVDALPRLAAAIRALRHGDGTMARFHGGGGGAPERIDRALAASGVRPGARIHETMGHHRLATARTTVFFDGGDTAERGAGRAAAASLHASLFCFEASIGGRPAIVSCGPGARFGEAWRQAARATAAHSGLTIDGTSSASITGAAGTLRAPGRTSCVREEDEDGARLIAEHDGYLKSHGLIHHRRISLSGDGRELRGEDHVAAEGPGPRAAFDRASDAAGADGAAGTNGTDGTKGPGVPYTIRFHLHPSIEAAIFLAGSAVRLTPPSGDVWTMRQLGGALTIEESVYLDEESLGPRATKQIVVRARATGYRSQVKWAFRRAAPDRPTGAAVPGGGQGGVRLDRTGNRAEDRAVSDES